MDKCEHGVMKGLICSGCTAGKEPKPPSSACSRKIIGYQSVALWPDEVCLGCDPNESTDNHGMDKELAQAICDGLEREGLGGERKIFPIKTEVRPIYENDQS